MTLTSNLQAAEVKLKEFPSSFTFKYYAGLMLLNSNLDFLSTNKKQF